MAVLKVGDKSYELDAGGFLVNFDDWDEDFAEAMATSIGMAGLDDRQWQVIRWIRHAFGKLGRCPRVYETCAGNRLHRFAQLEELFPTGYLRGACRLAGITYKQGCHPFSTAVARWSRERGEKHYTVDVRGFLVEPSLWDEDYAVCRAYDMKILELTDKHWQVIRYLRDAFDRDGEVPTVYQTCRATGVELEELERLFPDGYHRGAVKIAGLRVT